MAVLLTEQQHNSVITDAQASTNRGFYHDAISFLKLLTAADYYAKQQRISVVEIQWNTFTEESTTRMVSAFVEAAKAKNEELERSKNEASNQSAANASEFPAGRDSFPPNTEAFGDMMGGSSGATFVKKTLKPFENCKFPTVPVTIKAMTALKIGIKNYMRSMDLDHLLKESYIPPAKGEVGFEKYIIDNKFFDSAVVEIMTNPDHPARNWLMTEEIKNDGRSAYFKLVNHYDNETIEDSHGITAYIRWTNTKLTGVHLGAMKAYITKYQIVLSDAK